jgi:hypothetical protein
MACSRTRRQVLLFHSSVDQGWPGQCTETPDRLSFERISSQPRPERLDRVRNKKRPSLDFMARNVGIANRGRSACDALVIRSLDNSHRIKCRKPLPFIIFIPIQHNRNLLITKHLHNSIIVGIPCACTTCGGTQLIVATGDGLEVTLSSSSGEVLFLLSRAVKSSITGSSSTVHCSLLCERPGPCYRRTVFIGDGLAAQGSPCSSAADGQSAMVAGVQRRRQPHTLGSIDEHEYSGYARRSKHFLFRPCLSDQWTALRSRWAHRQLCRPAQCLHV